VWPRTMLGRRRRRSSRHWHQAARARATQSPPGLRRVPPGPAAPGRARQADHFRLGVQLRLSRRRHGDPLNLNAAASHSDGRDRAAGPGRVGALSLLSHREPETRTRSLVSDELLRARSPSRSARPGDPMRIIRGIRALHRRPPKLTHWQAGRGPRRGAAVSRLSVTVLTRNPGPPSPSPRQHESGAPSPSH
jgi:hypothetical protein